MFELIAKLIEEYQPIVAAFSLFLLYYIFQLRYSRLTTLASVVLFPPVSKNFWGFGLEPLEEEFTHHSVIRCQLTAILL